MHNHTKYYYGDLTPVELAIQAKENGIDIISITDHYIIKETGEELILLGTAGKVYYTKHLTNG